MKSEAQQVFQTNTSEVWAGESTSPAPAKKLPGLKLLAGLATLAAAAAIGTSAWVYVSGLQKMRDLSAQIGDNTPGSASRIVEYANHWALTLESAAIGGGVAVFAVAILGGFVLRQRWLKRHLGVTQDADGRAQRLLGQLADAKVSEEEARSAEKDLKARLSSVSNTLAGLERELEERRLTEKNLAQQATQLERSKDVLEIHVQSRTQELQKLQRRNEQILNSAADGICGFDASGRATFVNHAVAKMVGWSLESLAGKTEEMIFFPNKTKGSPGFLKGEKGEYLSEQIFYRKDGSTFPAEYTRTSITENGRTIGTVVTVKDITLRKLAEDQLNHKAAELARSNQELEQFAFVASHDLQEPLRKIQAFGDRLKEKCEAAKLTEGKDYLERMQSAAARMQTLINDLLTFSRVISSQQPFALVDLGAVTQEVLVDLECRIEKTGAQVTVGKLPALQADATQMRQLLQNLIGNALKFQPPNSIPTVKVDAQLIQRDQIQDGATLPKPPPTASPDDKFCVLTVQDNGIGFDEQYLEKVFAVFQRLHGRSEYEGTGVGLAVCRRIAERHGGLITAQSKPGEGAIFIVILPLKQPLPEEPK